MEILQRISQDLNFERVYNPDLNDQQRNELMIKRQKLTRMIKQMEENEQ